MSDEEQIIERAIINTVEGAVLAAPDGAVYYLSNAELEAFRVPDEGAAALHERLGITSAGDAEVSGFASSLKLGDLSLSGPINLEKTPFERHIPMSGTLIEGLLEVEYRRR